ncbi:MAG: hypothetical protein HZB91_06055 [Elusimicrobia bacterium]|nr:hypothetical protein [Elusimicrobiota bacterium]
MSSSMAKPVDSRLFRARHRSLTAAASLLGFLRTSFFLAAVFMIGISVLARFKDADRYPASQSVLRAALSVERPIRDFLRDHFPTEFQGRDTSKIMLVAACFILSSLLSKWGKHVETTALRIWDEAAELDENEATILSKVGRLRKGKLTRGELMEVIAAAQKALEKHKQKLSFLSIDVVNSTGMKLGEDPAKAERDFIRYKTMVEEILRQCHYFKVAWTPDGVMICFLETRDALLAGQGVVKELRVFNREVKTIKHDFAVRVGVNTGELLTEDATPMEEMTDRVIDVAGHMQKYGAVGAVTVSEHAVKPLLAEFKYKPTGKVVDGCPVYEWVPPPEEPPRVSPA